MQAKNARDLAAELERQLNASESAAASTVEELQGVISVLNAQLDEASSHTDQSDQESSFYSHFDGRAIFGGSSFWLQDQPMCVTDSRNTSVTNSPAAKPLATKFEAPANMQLFEGWGQAVHR